MNEQAEVDKIAQMATRFYIDHYGTPLPLGVADLFKVLMEAYEMGFDRATTVIKEQLLKDLSEGNLPNA